MSPPVLFGLVLAGGASTRMQRDKAALLYHGKPQLQWTYDLLTEVCERVFVSVRANQAQDPLRAGLPQIIDRLEGKGPIAGIVAAQKLTLTSHGWCSPAICRS
jgi:molybdopterin-guanine dinucleotide biosynthesis protein A